jgi:hypothetical protein
MFFELEIDRGGSILYCGCEQLCNVFEFEAPPSPFIKVGHPNDAAAISRGTHKNDLPCRGNRLGKSSPATW